MNAYPPSFDNSPMIYAWALGSITSLAILNLTVFCWMARDIWRDRFYIHPKTSLTAFRVTLMLAGLTGFLRGLPEALYMFLWNEVGVDNWRIILLWKRLMDSIAIAPGAAWTLLLMLSYPTIANALKNQGNEADLWSSWPHAVRPIFALVVIFSIAFLVAISKLYMGIPHK